ncbi:MAG: hypothetical protein MJY87_09375 [Fibrobacter sp.]|nr:hypothetical protein [Fibrobacter sp.]
MSFFKSRRSVLLDVAILCFFLGGWVYSYLSPVVRGLMDEHEFCLKDFEMDDYHFFGTVSHASVPSLFGGTDIPFLDKVNFQINSDEDSKFVLYASQEIMDEMSEWYSFGGFGAGSIPLEIIAARVDEHTFVVHYMASADGELDFETLVEDYQFHYAFLGVCLVAILGLLGLIFLILWLVLKRKSGTIKAVVD